MSQYRIMMWKKNNDAAKRQRIIHDIEKYDCHLIMIEDDGYLPGFVYTIGLYEKFGHPELICFGLPKETTSAILNDVAALIKEGRSFTPYKLYDDFLEGYPMQFLPVDKSYHQYYVGYGSWYYNNADIPVLQIVWPDKASLFPWEEGFNKAFKFKQPLLDRNTEFKFYEERNAATFATIEVLEGAPILYVYHDDDDGTWQFNHTRGPSQKTSKIVGLESITKMDPSVNEVHCLPLGRKAWRKSPNDKWEF